MLSSKHVGGLVGKKIRKIKIKVAQIVEPLRNLTVAKVRNAVAERSGYAALPVRLQKAKRPREITLDLTGYRQIDSFSCGGVAAAMAVKFFRPRLSFARIYAAVSPTRNGSGTVRVVHALRSLDLSVSWRKSLSFDDVCDAIDRGGPVLVCVKTGDEDTDHWVVSYGYGRRPDILFIAGRGIPLLSGNRMRRRDFRHLWSPPGEGLVCSKAR